MTLILIVLCLPSIWADFIGVPDTIKNGVFPNTFKFGVSTSSYQVEGGWLEGGKGPTTLDVAYHIPGNAVNNDNGDIANDMYHLYPEDVQSMKNFGIKNYRYFSVFCNLIEVISSCHCIKVFY